MKYVLMFTSRPDLDAAVDPEQAQLVYKQIYEWFGENADRSIVDDGAELHPVPPRRPSSTATPTAPWSSTGRSARPRRSSVASRDRRPDMDAAIAMAKTWPLLDFPGVAVEIRPMVEDYSQFE